jgi:hypothetical protein
MFGLNMAKLKPFDKIHHARITKGLSITQKCILMVIASHLGKQEFANLSLNTLQIECSINKRSCLVDNLDYLIQLDIVWKILPGSGFKSCRYGINFDLLVTVGHQTSDLRSLDQSPTVTSAVTVGHPKRKLNSFKRNLKEPLVDKINGKAKSNAESEWEKIRKTCGLKGH